MKSLKAFRGGVGTSHLVFADYLLLFAEAIEDQVACIKEILKSFCKASDPSINFNKSLIFISPNVSEHVAPRLSSGMGIPLTKDLGFYLGHHLVHRVRNNKGHNKLLQRVRDRLDGWKTKCLS